MRQIADEAIKPFYDATLDSRYTSANIRYKEQVRAELRSSPEYEEVKTEIETCLESVDDAIEELKAAQADGIERLRTTPVAQFE